MNGSTIELQPHSRPQSLQRAAEVPFCQSTAIGLAAAVFSTFLLSFAVRAEQLPLRKYTTADGLASNSIYCVKRDSHGFLWFCTPEGLSRFDGYTFVNYGAEQGLPDRIVRDFVETPGGEYWVGTSRGLVKFNPKPFSNESMFVFHRLGEMEAAQGVNALLADRQGDIWAGTYGGVFHLTKVDERWISHQVVFPTKDAPLEGSESPLIEDHAGNIWIAKGGPQTSLWRRRPGGEVEQLADPFFVKNKIVALFEDRAGRIWVGTYHGLALLAEHPGPRQPTVARVYTKKDGFLDDVGAGITFQSSDGRLWAVGGGLYEVLADGDGRHAKFRLVGRSQEGFSGVSAEDAQGNLWMGPTKISTHGFVTYSVADGLTPSNDIRSVAEGYDGELYVVTGVHSRFLHRFDGSRFTTVTPLIPGYDASKEYFWGWGQIHFQDHAGEWWEGTAHGLVRYPLVARLEDLARTRPRAIYTTHDGLAGDDIWRLYEDSHGDIWIGAWGGPGLTKWERETGRFHVFTEAEGWKPGLFSSLREDHFGNIWIGRGECLARFREGRFTYFTPAQGYPSLVVVSMFVDHTGQLWVATNGSGLVRVADPSADHPQFAFYTTREGISSNDVRAITEDHWGRIYFWTGRGVDRLQPNSGAIRHYTEADGLVMSGSDHSIAFTDRHGRLWFGADGLSRLDPEPEELNAMPPPIRITDVRIRGVAYPVSELGEMNLSGLVLDPDQNAIQIDFASINFGVGQVLRFQYKLEGTEHDWSLPTELRTVNYAKLNPGTYQFQVRTVNAEGVVSSSPALFTFRLLAPVWQRWWFLSLAILLSGLATSLVYRYRVNRLLELERIRTRIATNLHDDIGSSLTQISILSEVANRKLEGSSTAVSEPLSRIAELSRDAVDAMGDIVWAVNPRRDTLGDLIQRIRRFGSDVLSTRGIEFTLRIPGEHIEPALRGDLRQEIFLIFKEAINNIVRHADCKHVEVTLFIENGQLVLSTKDDGRGFESVSDGGDGRHGHGLASMKARAQSLAGTFLISSELGRGTTISVRVPLDGRARSRAVKIPT